MSGSRSGVLARAVRAGTLSLLSWSAAAFAAQSGGAPPPAATPGATSAPGDTPAAGYAPQDFASVDKIDAHVHLHGALDAVVGQARADGFRLLTINTDYPDFPPVPEQLSIARSLHERYPGVVAFAGTFRVDRFGTPEWPASASADIDAAAQAGAVAIKVWKNIGLALQDRPGHWVQLDDARFEPVWSAIESRHLVLLGHQAEPRNCWLPYDQMTVRSDREYFREHPQYYMHDHPEMPSHEAILAARDRMLGAHPDLRFVGVHLASLEWDVDRAAAFLDRFPSAHVDVAARMVHLEHQTVRHRDKVRRFLIRYQDRILYGTDIAVEPDEKPAMATDELHRQWLHDWQYLTSDAPLQSNEFPGHYRGLRLPRSVVAKIFAGNARTVFPGAFGPASAGPMESEH